MNAYAPLRLAGLFALIAMIGGIPEARTVAGDPVVSQRPLTQTARIKPAFIMAVDDSGSMNWETLFANPNGTGFFGRDTALSPYSFYQNDASIRPSGSGFLELFPFPGRSNKQPAIPPTGNFGFARSHEFNPSYFDPGEIYPTWARYDGTSWADANPTAARVNPRVGGSLPFNLTSVESRNDNTGYRFNFVVGMVVPAGTSYYRGLSANCDFSLGPDIHPNNAWSTLTTDRIVGANCLAYVEYFPATYYLTTPASPDGNIAGTPVLQVGGPRGVPIWETLYRYEVKPGNYASPADYTAAMRNFANWFQYYRDRNLAMVAAMTQAFIGIDFMRVGYFTINNRVAVNMRDMADNSVGGARDQLYAAMTALPANSGTPNRFAVDHLGIQFRRTGAGAPVQLACQVNAGMLFTDGYSNSGGPAVGNVDAGMGSPFADGWSNTIADVATRHYLDNIRPDLDPGRVNVPAGCASPTPDPRLDCRKDPHMNFYGITLGALGRIYGNDAAATTDPYANPPAWFNDLNDQPEAVDAIWHATLNTRGRFINAQSPSAVRDAMREVLNAVNDGSLGSGSISGAGARVPGDNLAITVEPGFTVGNNGTDWTGELTAFRVNPNGTIGATLWSASTVLPAHGARNIIVATQAGNSTTVAASNFQATNLGATDNAQLLALGLTPLKVLTNFPGATPTQLVNYLRGDVSREQRNGGPLRNRSKVLGDIVNSTPNISTGRDDYGWEGIDASYPAFLTAKATRPDMVYVGGNDGMLHAFRANNGVEAFGFIPKGVLSNMGDLPFRLYPHRFYVDGNPVISDVKVGGSWRTALVGTTAAGGRSVFALDIRTPTTFTGSNVMWELTSAAHPELGYTFGRPVIVPVNIGGSPTFVAIIGNGYGDNATTDHPNDPVLFVINMATGNVLRKLTGNDLSSAYNGLGQIAVIDRDGDGLADTVYGGDLQGNLWKFDLSSSSTAAWNVAFGNVPLFRATDGGGMRQPITGDIEVASGPGGGVSVYFGTGRYFAEGDNLVPPAPQIQSLYGVYDNGSTPAGTRTNLARQEILSQSTAVVDGVTIRSRQTTRNPVNYAIQRGFYMDLALPGPVAAGEMFIGNPRIQSGVVFFTTFEPVGDPCTPGGRNWIYGLDLTTGGAALQNIRITSGGTTACTGNCGAIAIAEGSPVTDTSIFIPRPTPLPGLTCVAGTPGCDDPATLDDALQRCTLVIRAPGSPPLILPRPCGRQSWRQVR